MEKMPKIMEAERSKEKSFFFWMPSFVTVMFYQSVLSDES